MRKKPESSVWRSLTAEKKGVVDNRAAKLRELRLADEAARREAGCWGDLTVREVTHEPTGAVFVHYWKGGAGPVLHKPARVPGLSAAEHAAYVAWVERYPAEDFSQAKIAWNVSKSEALRIKQERIARHVAANVQVINGAAAS
jgi:hypothetical protein